MNRICCSVAMAVSKGQKSIIRIDCFWESHVESIIEDSMQTASPDIESTHLLFGKSSLKSLQEHTPLWQCAYGFKHWPQFWQRHFSGSSLKKALAVMVPGDRAIQTNVGLLMSCWKVAVLGLPSNYLDKPTSVSHKKCCTGERNKAETDLRQQQLGIASQSYCHFLV